MGIVIFQPLFFFFPVSAAATHPGAQWLKLPAGKYGEQAAASR